jgi:hypothetical protein
VLLVGLGGLEGLPLLGPALGRKSLAASRLFPFSRKRAAARAGLPADVNRAAPFL